jgi:hypothetical protein
MVVIVPNSISRAWSEPRTAAAGSRVDQLVEPVLRGAVVAQSVTCSVLSGVLTAGRPGRPARAGARNRTRSSTAITIGAAEPSRANALPTARSAEEPVEDEAFAGSSRVTRPPDPANPARAATAKAARPARRPSPVPPPGSRIAADAAPARPGRKPVPRRPARPCHQCPAALGRRQSPIASSALTGSCVSMMETLGFPQRKHKRAWDAT